MAMAYRIERRAASKIERARSRIAVPTASVARIVDRSAGAVGEHLDCPVRSITLASRGEQNGPSSRPSGERDGDRVVPGL